MRLIVPLILSAAPLIFLIGCDSVKPANTMRDLKSASADRRREAIATLVTQSDFGKREPDLGYYRSLAQDDDYTVKAMAIRALNIARDHSATSIFIIALKDNNELVRLEAVKALANLPDPTAVQPLLQVLEGTRMVESPDGHPTLLSENKDVRIAAADALRQYRTLDVARVLVTYLNETEFGVAWQSRQSLITLTGQDLKYDESAWLQYLVGPSKPFG
jgi:HEAT repeat protein